MKRSYNKMIVGCIALLVLLAASGCGVGESESVLDDVEPKQEAVVSDTADSSGASVEKQRKAELEDAESEEAVQADASTYDEGIMTISRGNGSGGGGQKHRGPCAGWPGIHHRRYQRRRRSGIDDRNPAGVRRNGERSLHAGGRQAPIRL